LSFPPYIFFILQANIVWFNINAIAIYYGVPKQKEIKKHCQKTMQKNFKIIPGITLQSHSYAKLQLLAFPFILGTYVVNVA